VSASRTYRVGILVLVIGLAVGACSDSPSAEVTAFCDDYIEVNTLFTTGPDEADPAPWFESLTAGLEGLKADAPTEISTAVNDMADALLEPVANFDEEGLFAATESEDFAEDSAVVDEYIGGECGFATVDVIAVNYAFEADFDAVDEGMTAFGFTNNGSEMHEMVLMKVSDDTTETIEELLELPEEEAEEKTTFMGVSFAAPGEESTMYAELEAGRYAVICFIPTGVTSFEEFETADGPPHFVHGMIEEFTVEG
jgi:hypothetical protein